ncbi:MAG: hypothetical protein RUMPE_01226 [Eubacteriales bacterium SKADARSKE-1]|nr:hypothetical protein [Eubacteriales bacterium SKADARSKE-1]
MSNLKLSLNEFTESLAGMIEYNQKVQMTNEKEYKRLLNILSKVVAGELTDRQKECIIMKYYKNLSVTQIACELKIGKSTVSRHISKARNRLHKILYYYVVSN